MFNFGPRVLKNGTDLDLKEEVVKPTVFGKRKSFVGEARHKMNRSVAHSIRSQAARFFRAIRRINGERRLDGLADALDIGLHVAYYADTGQIGDLFQRRTV